MRSVHRCACIVILLSSSNQTLLAEQLRGDVSLLRLAAQLYSANKSRLESWSGRVLVKDVNMHNRRQVMEVESVVQFFWTLQPRRLRWQWKVNKYFSADEQSVPKFHDYNGILDVDSFSTLAIIPNSKGTNRQILVTGVDRFSVGPRSNTFDPMHFFGYRGEDAAEWFTFMADNSKDMKNWTVTRNDDVVVMLFDDGTNINRYEVDLSKGGTLARYKASSGTEAGLLESEEWLWTYERLDEVWVPNTLRYSKEERFEIKDGLPVPTDGERVSIRNLTWQKSLVNQPISEDEFNFDQLGLRDADVVVDQLTGKTYRYHRDFHGSASTAEKWGAWRIAIVVGNALVLAAIIGVLIHRRWNGRYVDHS